MTLLRKKPLTFLNPKPGSWGEYECKASNRLGHASATTSITGAHDDDDDDDDDDDHDDDDDDEKLSQN